MAGDFQHSFSVGCKTEPFIIGNTDDPRIGKRIGKVIEIITKSGAKLYAKAPQVERKSYVRILSSGDLVRFKHTGKLPPITELPDTPYQPKPLPGQNAKRVVSNLAKHRWYGGGLTATEEADLIRRAQAGDKRAGATLLRFFHRLIRKYAGRHRAGKRGVDLFDDLIAAGALGFWQAILSFKFDLGCRLATHAMKRVASAISDESVRSRQRALAGASRLDRLVLYGGLGVDDIAANNGRVLDLVRRVRNLKLKRPVCRSFQEAAEKIREISRRYSLLECSTIESNEDDGDGYRDIDPVEAGDEGLPKQGAPPGPSADAKRFYSCFGQNQFSGHLRWHGKAGRPDQTRTLSGFVESLAIESDKRAVRHLKQIGRQAYALELWQKEQRQLAARAEPEQYLYPWKRPTPVDHRKAMAVSRIINRQRKPSIRAWRPSAKAA